MITPVGSYEPACRSSVDSGGQGEQWRDFWTVAVEPAFRRRTRDIRARYSQGAGSTHCRESRVVFAVEEDVAA
jgi:hypothetical protein